MNDTLQFRTVAVYLATVLFGFEFLRYSLEVNHLMILLNGVFIGTLFAFAVALWPLTKNVMLGKVDGQDVGWFTVGLLALVLSAAFGAFASTMLRVGDGVVLSAVSTLSPATRYAAIVGLLTIVYAPDAGRDFLHGRDRKIIAVSVLTGMLAAVVSIYAQIGGVDTWLRF